MTLIQILEGRRKALKVHEVAELLEVSKQHVYEMAADGSLPAFQVGRSIRIDPQDLADWLRKNISAIAPSRGQHKTKKVADPKPSENRKECASVHSIWRERVNHLKAASVVGGSSTERQLDKTAANE